MIVSSNLRKQYRLSKAETSKKRRPRLDIDDLRIRPTAVFDKDLKMWVPAPYESYKYGSSYG